VRVSSWRRERGAMARRRAVIRRAK